jgi:hypothetical protein
MTDEEFIRALESCTLPQHEFAHAGHVRAAYLYFQSGDFAATLARMRRAIRDYSASLGKPERYHETITVAYTALIRQYLYERGNAGNWAAFAGAVPELFQPGLLLRFYSRSQLDSDLARKVFLLPCPTNSLRRPDAQRAE